VFITTSGVVPERGSVWVSVVLSWYALASHDMSPSVRVAEATLLMTESSAMGETEACFSVAFTAGPRFKATRRTFAPLSGFRRSVVSQSFPRRMQLLHLGSPVSHRTLRLRHWWAPGY
jgi:hypothetical protein